MKKITLLLALISLSHSSFSQDEPTFFRPLQGDMAFSFNLSGLFDSLYMNNTPDPLTNAQMADFRYFWKDNVAFRFGFGINRLNTTTTTTNDTLGGLPLVETENKDNQTGITIGLGIEQHIKTKSKRTDPFVGAGLILSRLGNNTVTNDIKTTQLNLDYTQTVTETINPGGTVFGVAVNAGFFWYFTHNLALGGELALGFVTGAVGGDVERTQTSTTSIGGNVTTAESSTTFVQKLNISALQTRNTGSIHLLVKF